MRKKLCKIVLSLALILTNMMYYQETKLTSVKAETVEDKTIGFLAPDGYAVLELNGTYTTTQKVSVNTAISLTGNTTITVSSGNGILLGNDIKTYIALNGYTLNVKTTAQGMAGIRVPKSSTLIVKEGSAKDGQLIVKGGPGTAPTAGQNGGDPYNQDTGGDGGAGGKGGNAPGAGIGGDGGVGGSGGASIPNSGNVTNGSPRDRNGNDGKDGTAGEVATDNRGLCGDVYVYGRISVNATAGDHKTASLSRATGGSTMDSTMGKKVHARSGGGGGGGAGGSAYGAAGIGGGGVGGGGGGSGAAGGARWRDGGYDPGASPAGGAGGGAGQTGGYGGYAGKGTMSGNDGQNGSGHAGGTGGAAVETNNGGYGGSGGTGGASKNVHSQSQLGKLYVSNDVTLKNNNSPNATTSSAGNAKFNGFYLLSELDVQIKDADLIKYTGQAVEPTTSDGTLSIKDKAGNDITSVLNTNYTLTYDNNVDAGDMSAKITIQSAGDPTDPNYLYVDGGSYTFYFSIQQNDDPISIKKANSTMEYTYGENFQATIETAAHTPYLWNNPGTIKWEGEQDTTHTGNVGGENKLTSDVYISKVGNGNLKLKASIVQEGPKNANGIYNFTDVSATLDDDIKLNHKNIDDSDISLSPLREYLYIGGQIQPHYTVTDGNNPIEFKLNKDSAHKVLEEGVDYELIYDENTNVADGGKVTVKGIGNYDGLKNPIKFVINARSLTDPDVKVALINPEYTGKELRPQPVLTIFGNILPTSDYDLNWKSFKNGVPTSDDLINVGKKQIEISGKNNLKDSRNQEYENVQADISKISLDITQAKDVIFDGKEIESRPSLKYNGLVLSEDGTFVDTSLPILNPNDFKISFANHKEVGTATITLTGMENFKGVKTLSYQVLPRPLYIQPDSGQWKYYGAKDIFGANQTELHPTYRTYIRALNSSCTEELKVADAKADEANLLYVKDNLPISGYAIQLENNLSREGANDWINTDQPDTTYKFTIDNLKLSDATKKNYEVKLIDNEATYKLESYIYGGAALSLNGTIGKNDWYVKKPATLKAPSGFSISKKNGLDVNENPWNNEISYPDGDYSKDGIPYFLRVSNPGDPADGAISKGLNIMFKQDTIAPTGNVAVASDSWSSLNKDVIFDYYLNSDARGLIYAKDAGSQVNTKHYYISDKKMSMDELEALEVPYEEAGGYNPLGKSSEIAVDVDTSKEAWISENQFILNIDELNTQRKIIYSRIEDYAGNVTYLNTDGIVFDKDAPILKAQYKENGQWTTSNEVKITGSAFDENAGLKDRYLAYQIDDGALQVIDVASNNEGSFEITNLIDGNYNLVINAWDKANNESTPISFRVMKDTQMPRILVSADTTTIATKQKIKITPNVGASGSAKIEVRYNGGEWKEIENGVNGEYYAHANGEYSFRLTNGAGVVSNESKITLTKIDANKPVIDMVMKDSRGNIVEENGFINSKASVTFSNTVANLGDAKFEYSFDGSTWTEVNENLDNVANFEVNQPEGTYTIYLRIQAVNGLSSTKQFHYAVDLTAPKVANMIKIEDAKGGFMRLLSDLFFNKKQVVTMEAIDEGIVGAISGIDTVSYYTVKGKDTLKSLPSDAKGIEALVKEQWSDGNQLEVDKGSQYIVYFKVVDKAGNISYARSDRIVIDDAAPEIEITYDKANEWDNNPKMEVYVWDESPGIDRVLYRIDGQLEVAAGESFTIQNLGLTDGKHTIEVQAWDKSGNTSTSSIEVQQDSGLPSMDASIIKTTEKEVTVGIKADYNGPSGFDRVEMSKNGQDFEDITEELLGTHQDASYIVNENGTFIFRAYTKAGKYKDATITITHFNATKEDLKAIASAKTADGKEYTNGTWTNQDITLNFSNQRANLKGLSYYLQSNNGAWQLVNASSGYVTISNVTEGTSQYAFKVVLDTTLEESNIVNFTMNIDKSKPTASMEIKNVSWTGSDTINNGFIYDNYFNTQEYALIKSDAQISGIEHNEMFAIKESEIPEAIKGVSTASKIEELGKDRWTTRDRLLLLPNDAYVVFGKVYDNAGNVTYVSSNGVVFDDVNPTITTDIDQVGWYKDDTTDIHFQSSDNLSSVDKITYEINKGSTQTAILDYDAFTLSSSEFLNGTNTIDIHVKDKAGNTYSETFTANKDMQAPTITVVDSSDPNKLFTKNIVDISLTTGVSGVAKVEVKIPDAGSWIDITDTYAQGYTIEENGTYWFRVVSGSNVSEVQSFTVGNISKDIPVITYVMSNGDGTTYHEGEWKKEAVKVQFTNENANQVVAKYLYKVDDGAYKECVEERNNSAIFTSVEGEHRYTLKLILENGLESEETSVVIRIDNVAPRIQVHSDLTQWVKENQELEVEVLDDESGVDSEGYSFDNGVHWQESNKATIRANKIVGIRAKDSVANTADTKAIVDKIDSQGPSVMEFKQLGEQASQIRELEAKIEDYCDLTNRSGSGIAQAYVMTSYPYKDGEFEENPETTYELKSKNGTWVTEKAISVPYDGTNDVWLVTEDNVGNMKIYSTKVTNMIGVGDDEGNTDKPTPDHPDQPNNPSETIKPSNPGEPTTKPDTSNTSGGSGSTENSLDQKISYQDIVNSNTVNGDLKKADGLTTNEEDLKRLKELKEALAKNKQASSGESEKITSTDVLVTYVIPWLLLLIVGGWIIFLRVRYCKKKKALKEKTEG